MTAADNCPSNYVIVSISYESPFFRKYFQTPFTVSPRVHVN